MKFLLRVITIVAASISSVYLSADLPVYDVTEYNTESLHDLFNEIPKDAIFKIPAGVYIPMKLALSGDILELDMANDKPLMVKTKRTLYVKMEGLYPFFSVDKENWAPFCKMVTRRNSFDIATFGEYPVISLQSDIRLK